MAWDATPRKLEALIEPGTEEPEEKKVEEQNEEKEKGSQESE
jgi:hypothetical protein